MAGGIDMTSIHPSTKKGFWNFLFASPEERRERREQKLLERRKRKEADIQVARDLRDSGYYDQTPDALFYRHYYM
ncbi:MAG: hypothetical protein AAGB28_13785 [Pseudomonadota bacterium]